MTTTSEPSHGTAAGYRVGCRCDGCRAGHSAYQKALRAERRARLERGEVEISHGLSGYTNWGCRCETCRSANSIASADNHARASREREKPARPAPAHGESRTYNRGCRCDECKAATAKRHREQRARNRTRTATATFNHGASGYSNWGCRCEVCVAAHGAKTALPTRRWQRQVQQQTNDQAANRGKEWTGPELETAARDDLSIAEIARLLRRSYTAVLMARHRLAADPKTIALAGLPNQATYPTDPAA